MILRMNVGRQLAGLLAVSFVSVVATAEVVTWSGAAQANPKWTATGSLTASRRKVKIFADAEGLKARLLAAGMTVIVR